METFVKYQDKILEEWKTYGMYKIYDISSKTHNPHNPDNPHNPHNPATYTLFSGPPFCSGKLHMGHCAVETIKSIMLNYKSMMGFKCDSRMGYDCHGLPIESVANRELGISTLQDLEKIGMTQFNQFCKETIQKCERDWDPVYNSIGRWADFSNVYKTMDTNYMESVWWAFSELYRKGLIYRGYKITPYSYPLQSPLSNFEASQGYKDVDCRSVYVRFEIYTYDLKTYPKNPLYNIIPWEDDTPTYKKTYMIAWTTTPWTLPANLALCVNATLDYDVIETETGDIYILGSGTYTNASIKPKCIHGTIKGADLLGIRYKPLFENYQYNLQTLNKLKRASFTIITDDYVKPSTDNTGTAVVHIAPLFGEDDYRVCKEQVIITDDIMPYLELLDKECRYLSSQNPKYPRQFQGQLVFEAETDIIKSLKASNALIRIQQIRHEYPHCYRTDVPLVYRACESFYVSVESIKSRMMELNSQVKWYPESIGTQRFHKWLDGARDWCISRSRYFGTPIPVWIADEDKSLLVIGSIKELETYSGMILQDIHPEFINDIVFSHNGKTFRRVSDIFDCWFESGCMPFAQFHYPFNTSTNLDSTTLDTDPKMMFQSDFIVEGLDQTRGWFYTLLILSTALFDIAPSRNIMAVGLILDEHKQKISKKLKNYVDPEELISKYGADSIRLYLLQSSITSADPLAFKEDDIKILNKELFQFRSAVDFLVEHITNQQHQNINFDPLAYQYVQSNPQSNLQPNPMDIWILEYMNSLTREIVGLMDRYQIAQSTRLLINTIENITNWYVKFNRDRLKGKTHIYDSAQNSNGPSDWQISTSVLYQVIMRYITLLAPFAPFISQSIYNTMKTLIPEVHESELLEKWVHQRLYSGIIPNEYSAMGNRYLKTFELLKRVAKMVRAARMGTSKHTSSKTPIKQCQICMDNPDQLEMIATCIELIQSELNILDVGYSSLSGIVEYRIQPERALIGKKYKKQAGEIYKYLAGLPPTRDKIKNPIDISNLSSQNTITILPEEYSLEPVFSAGDMIDHNLEGNILIKLDFTFDNTITTLSHIRRLIAHIQQTRKHMGLKPWNKICIDISHDDFGITTIPQNIEHIKSRLECDISIGCSSSGNEFYYRLDEESIQYISYKVIML
jgi:isoleucyl-tRNA synthetase